MKKSKVYYKNTFYLLLLIIVFSIFIKFFQYNYLDDKYFYDSNGILEIISGLRVADKSYMFTADFFKTMNIFKFNSLFSWGIFLTIISVIPLFIFLLKKEKKYTILQYVFIYMSMFFLGIYVFNLGKDYIQFLFFLLMYIVIKNKNISNLKKMILISFILIFEALNFRIYYIIMLGMIWIFYSGYLIFLKNKQHKYVNMKKIVILSLISFFIIVFIAQKISVENYNSLINARNSVNLYRENSTDALTIINDLLGNNNNYFIFIGNYIINSFRIMFPIELITVGIKYLPFIVYQIYITLNIIKSIKNVNKENILTVIIIVSYEMVAIIFEPDFGSFIRHQTALFLFLVDLILINENARKVELNENCNCNTGR